MAKSSREISVVGCGVDGPGTLQTWHLKKGNMRSSKKNWQTRYSSKLASPKVGNMRSNEELADQVLLKPGTSKIGNMRSNEKLADQVLPKPGTSNTVFIYRHKWQILVPG